MPDKPEEKKGSLPKKLFVGFAVGRTVFWDPLKALHEKKQTRDDAIQQIAQNYKSFCDLWIQARQTQSTDLKSKPNTASL